MVSGPDQNVGDDGHCFMGSGHGVEFASSYGPGDTGASLTHTGKDSACSSAVGCGVNIKSQKVFFTLNGELLDPELELNETHTAFYPCNGTLSSSGCF